MSRLDLSKLSVPDARLVQHGLKALGFYEGTTRGLPGPKTGAAYEAYLASFANVPGGSTPEERPAEGAALARRLVEILRAEVGVREVPRNSNRGPRVEEYQRATWLPGTSWPWCAAFVCWGVLQLEKEFKLPFARPRTAGAWDFERWAREQGVRLFKPRGTVKAGDIVVFTFSHIGVAIEDQRGTSVRTVEGNTDEAGSREGGGVYEKTRALSLVRSHIRLELASGR